MKTLEATIIGAAKRDSQWLRAAIVTAEDRDNALAAFKSLSTLSSLAHIEESGMSDTARAELLAVEKEAAKSLKELTREPALPTIAQLLDAFDVSYWLKTALSSAVNRDPVDSASDAALLHLVLEAHASSLIEQRSLDQTAQGTRGA